MKLIKLERIGNGAPYSFCKVHAPYCRQVIGIAKNGFPMTKNMEFKRDYNESNSVGTRGVFDWYILREGGIYEIYSPQNFKKARHYYLFISHDGKEKEMDLEEVYKCLSTGLVPMY
jgi:hypothetical protein